ncbi:MAG: LacI family transcriptional regulator [Planctomycetota bacterium]|nr:LacI family transcriptional regulator [Planctomycetota bacterium]
MRKRKPGILDVAQRAGVSRSTVSLVLNASAVPSEAVRERVQQAVRELGYTPDPVARSLRRGTGRGAGSRARTGVIAFVIAKDVFLRGAHKSWTLMQPLALAIQQAAERREVVAVHLYDRDRDGPLCLPVGDLNADGVLGQVLDLEVAFGLQADLPVVLYNSQFDPLRPIPTVNLDERGAIRRIVHHLAELGHRRVGYFRAHGGTQNWQLDLREEAFDRARADLGLHEPEGFKRRWPVSPETHGEVTRAFAAEAAKAARAGALTALVCPGDVYAFDVAVELAQAGLRVPEDLSLTGFDDNPEPRGWAGPGLTTVRYPVASMLRSAMDLLNALIERRIERVGETLLTPELLVRESTCAPRKT